MHEVFTYAEGCNVKFTWKAEDNGGSPILQYVVSVESKDRIPYVIEECGTDPDSNSCLVSMEMLAKAPFYLQAGDTISNKVFIQAKNLVGLSEESGYNLI